MSFDEPIEQAGEYARSALGLMDRHAIPAHPENFAIWYGYCCGRYPDLTKIIDTLISNKQEFTRARNEDLYDHVTGFDREGRMLQETSARIEGAVNEVLGFLGTADESSSRYEEALHGFNGALSKAPPTARIRKIVANILAETKRMESHNKSLRGKLQASSQRISDLRNNLAEIRHEAYTDALTGIPNRKAFDTRLRECVMQAMESGADLSLLMLDIDHFKVFNDSYGHRLGDQVLKLVARTLTDTVKGRDMAARYGGEEFAILLPKTSLADAETVAEQVRAAVANKRIVVKNSGEDLGGVTLSLGVGRFRLGEPVEDFVNRADQALYAAKRDGRNRVVSETVLDRVRFQ